MRWYPIASSKVAGLSRLADSRFKVTLEINTAPQTGFSIGESSNSRDKVEKGEKELRQDDQSRSDEPIANVTVDGQ